MKFYNREDEMKLIRQTEERSRSTACFTAIMGRRRVGKTTLLRKALEGKNTFTCLFRVPVKYCCAMLLKER